jgi:hypothetical protein
MASSVPRTHALDIDGVWRINTIDKRIIIDGGRAYALDDWLHLLTLQVQPNMVVIRNIKDDGMGGYSGEDLPLMGKWQAKPDSDGALDVIVAGAMGSTSYRLLPVESGSYPDDDADNGIEIVPDEGIDDDVPPEVEETPSDESGSPSIGKTVIQIGRNCYQDFEPMGKSMLKYLTCQAGLGNINALQKTLTAKRVEDAKDILAARACYYEFTSMVETVRRKGFQSLSLGVSGELSAVIGGYGEAFVASNLDLTSPTLYGTLGVGLGTQAGGSLNGVVSVYYERADNLKGNGKSFAVSLKAVGGAGGAVGLSSGSSPRCESFSATAGAGGEVNAGSVSLTKTFRLARIPRPDFSAGCKDVSVRVTNRTGKQIKLVDVDFYDYVNRRWRSKIIKNTEISNGRSWSKKLRLQKVGGDKTRVKIQYRVKSGNGLFTKWSKVINRETQVQTCHTGSKFSTELM